MPPNQIVQIVGFPRRRSACRARMGAREPRLACGETLVGTLGRSLGRCARWSVSGAECHQCLGRDRMTERRASVPPTLRPRPSVRRESRVASLSAPGTWRRANRSSEVALGPVRRSGRRSGRSRARARRLTWLAWARRWVVRVGAPLGGGRWRGCLALQNKGPLNSIL
jgi:hypothetical protein